MLDQAKLKDRANPHIQKAIPWQDRKANNSDIVWRYDENPVVNRYDIPSSNSIFNSAIVPFNGNFAGVFRCDDKSISMNLHVGFSSDGINWELEHDPIVMQEGNSNLVRSDYRYDPRITFIDGKYWLTWCNGYYGPTIGIAYTTDFKTFHQCENAFLPYNRNGVLFPEKFDGRYAMLSRPSDNGHTAFGDIYLSYSPDMKYWGEHRMVMQVSPFEQSAWQCTKIGAGPVPIKTAEGWLIIYHGVIQTCNGFRYAMGAALTHLEKPNEVILRGKDYLLGPAYPYELMGDVPNVVFPVAALTENDKIAIYYGAADTTVCLCFGYISEIISYIKQNPI